jgi:peptidoglycan/xylan/chitin deacetylase (PgdA/CDA1 family)
MRVPMKLLRALGYWNARIVFRIANARHGVALTFDDGPHPENTPRILGALGEAGVHATFFFQGTNARRWPQLVRRTHELGHQVCSHGMEHISATKLGADHILKNAADCHAFLCDVVGEALSKLFRPPYGDMTWAGLRKLQRTGFSLAYWSHDSNDSFLPEPAAIVGRVRSLEITEGAIVLFHEDYARTADAMPGVLALLRDRGLYPATFADLRDHVAPR